MKVDDDNEEENNKDKTIIIKSSVNYGFVNENSILVNISENLGDDDHLLLYSLNKIICQLKSNSYIVGLELIYINRTTGNKKSLLKVEPEEQKEENKEFINQEFEFQSFEYITNMGVWLKNENLIGFEISTNKGRSKIFGFSSSNEKIGVINLRGGKKIVVGFGVFFWRGEEEEDDNKKIKERKGITSIFCYYLDIKDYYLFIYLGVFCLRKELKDKKFRKKIEKKIRKMKENLQVLYRTCLEPDNQFYGIMKFALA